MDVRLFSNKRRVLAQENQATLDAISRALAVIEFELDGTIRTANKNFLDVMGYTLDEVRGKHHRMFVTPAESALPDYKLFWQQLAKGEFQAAEYRRIGKDGKEVWIQATYNPVFGRDGTPSKIVKFATDVTEAKLLAADSAGQLAAISRSQAVIEFTPKGEVITANDNFCRALGYSLEEIRGRHHKIFVPPNEAASAAYQEFWSRLGRGEFQSAEYLRLGKGGQEVWIQATYNPIFDHHGKVFKIVKYATDVTDRKRAVNLLGGELAKLAKGDLRARIHTPFKGELDAVRLAYNNTVDRFAEIVARLRRSSGTLRAATAEILTGANDLAERTSRQASAIQETSAAMKNLADTVEENAARAEAARGKARAVSTTAEQSGAVMNQAQDAMGRILASSSQISNIVGLIDDIAFQTNLLALNASVEAARAGDAGKGFAVVAVEVRRLAQSAAQASSDVKVLIERSSSEISTGSRLLSDAAERIASMLGDVRDNSGLMDSIASGSREQSGAIAEVATAVRQMDEMTQHNAALVEETNAAIEQTEGQASELDRIVEVFVVEDAPLAREPAQEKPRAIPRAVRPAWDWMGQGNAALDIGWSER
ncbi:methyl-accepting chemotaxis protein [Devosia sp.]|uniref:methyl-accepting chemotaxis protein n=1 Tax=Devosia sp. TaxID=1871048 RepID=UPI001B06F58F|nr:methyl-accepting chemotaxis protein [Devosia sp.]MBO9588061.1 PAS domain S-box protein [Devosia sp.]